MLGRFELNNYRANPFLEPCKRLSKAIARLIENIELERDPGNPEVVFANELQEYLLQRAQTILAPDWQQLNRAKIVFNLLDSINCNSRDQEITLLKEAIESLEKENSVVMLGLLHSRQQEIDPELKKAISYPTPGMTSGH